MADFLSTRGISSELENIIKCAKKELYIITPYLRFSTLIYELLKSMPTDVEFWFIYGKTDLNSKEESLLRRLNCNILFKENLHAKCYLNETTAIVCSMNLHSFSEANNYEMGILFSERNDRKAYQICRQEIEIIKKNAQNIRVLKQPVEIEQKKYTRDDFQKVWIGYLKSQYKQQGLIEINQNIIVRKFPYRLMNMTNNYGIIEFEILLPSDVCRRLSEDAYTKGIFKSAKEYRVFWSFPFNKICLYWKKGIEFKSIDSELEYCKKGLNLILEELKTINI